MGDIIKFKKPTLSQQHQGKTLCKSGFHQWRIVDHLPFDVKRGGLVTRYRCNRCGAIKTQTQ
ncbi:MAG: hypothetical protein ACYDC8_13165 [Gammaproteobacteria bacterium]